MNSKILNYDVVVAGGGIAGVSCAYNCAKFNLKTLLIEKENYLGGDITGGLVVPVMKSESKNINCSFYNDLISFAKKFNAQHTYIDSNPGWFNPILLKCVLDDMLISKKCDLMFESRITSANTSDKIINDIKIETNTLSLPVVSKYYVDATGNASFAKILNCNFQNDNEIKQPPSLRFILSGVDVNTLAEFLEKIDSDKNITTTNRVDCMTHLSTAFTWDKTKKWALEPYFEQACKDGVLKSFDLSYFQIFTIANMPDSVAFNCPRIRDYKQDSPLDFSNAIIESRQAIIRLHDFVKKYIPGFQNSYISNIAPKTGYREIRRVKCKYNYTIEDIINQKEFDNPALCSDYPIDIHSNKMDKSVLHKVCSYTLPVESLCSSDYDNLYAIGKIAGCDFKSHAALRIQSSCMSMGEAVAKHIVKNIK